MVNVKKVKEYFKDKFEKYGTTPQGEDWNSVESQTIRFDQLIKVIDSSQPYSIIDYGCGYGALIDHLRSLGHSFTYQGMDILEDAISKAKELHRDCFFTAVERDLTPSDYVVESGIFNIKLDAEYDNWTTHVLDTLSRMNRLAIKGFAFNCLTKYSDADYIRPNLYYADPCFLFDYCKINFSKNVALLHDYELYDFTILVRK
jgi:SAM-dependent methyltransferase